MLFDARSPSVRRSPGRDDFSRCLLMFRIFDSGEAARGVSADLPAGKEILDGFLRLWELAAAPASETGPARTCGGVPPRW
ncbi:hypothetical protein CU254_25930 [Amycolatopsis sp. AA4]|uniref:hypothetical protein n=1 Tax=Actinomycetes TaxID=1760 RepID=UPI0001B545DD|nr:MULTISPECIES: hypothetical protein [Actinomycetes]ATY13486.1 hypothetical protein CU254_25930 [Amycolatopsis sp. AA4]